ncbi:MAG: hypothetical protein OEY49_20450, partial [Candidatus Heimdallarchaeota archaeon]|nr:hypothetical protein [Candidatus Heimdallarchaeota archaeon]
YFVDFHIEYDIRYTYEDISGGIMEFEKSSDTPEIQQLLIGDEILYVEQDSGLIDDEDNYLSGLFYDTTDFDIGYEPDDYEIRISDLEDNPVTLNYEVIDESEYTVDLDGSEEDIDIWVLELDYSDTVYDQSNDFYLKFSITSEVLLSKDSGTHLSEEVTISLQYKIGSSRYSNIATINIESEINKAEGITLENKFLGFIDYNFQLSILSLISAVLLVQIKRKK